MPEPTKADLKAAVATLTEENAALRDLLGAVRSYAEVPHPADCTAHAYQVEMENRLDVIAIWANADRENMNEHVYALVLADRAKELRERAAEPVRYKVRAEKTAEPMPVITDSGRTCGQANPGTGAWCHRDGDHGVHEDTDGQTWRTDGLRCECSHGQDEHDDADDSDAGRAQHECLHPGCGCGRFRRAALDEHEPTFLGGFPEDRDQPADVTA